MTALTVQASILPHQQLPKGDWWMWILYGGRGIGKTWRISSWLVQQALKYPGTNWGAVGKTWGETRRILAEGPSGIKAFVMDNGLEPLLLGGKWERAYNRSYPMELKFANGSIIQFGSADTPSSLRGLNLHGCGVDELFFWPEESFQTLKYAVRLPLPDGTPARVLAGSTPDGCNWAYDAFVEKAPQPGIRFIGGTEYPPEKVPSTFDNPHLDAGFVQSLRDTFEGTDFGQQEIFGAFLSLKGAIYTLDPNVHTRNGLAEAEPDFIWPESPEMCDAVIAGQDLGSVHNSAFVVLARPKGQTRWCVVAEVVKPANTEEDWSYAIKHAVEYWRPTRIWSDSNFPQTTRMQLQRGYPVKHTTKNAESVTDGIREVQRQLSAQALAVDAEACPELWKELKSYRWATDRNGEPLHPERPVKRNDDATDALRYAIYGGVMRRKKGLRIRG